MVSLQPATAGWSALVTRPGRASALADELTEELTLSGVEARCVIATEAAELSARLEQEADVVAVLHGLDHYQAADWRVLDVDRSRLERRRAIVMVLTEEALAGLIREAPHLASLVRHTWVVDEHAGELTNEETEERLQALRTRFGKSDADVLSLAEEGNLSGEPEYAEWLVLLGRGDLLGPQ